VHRFRSGGFQREVLILAPPSPTVGAPAVVVYHGLGSQPETMVPRLRLEELAGRGVVVVLPRAHRDARLGWGLGPGGVADITLWEDLRTCLVARAGVDPARITISGFSAGALWSTLTLLHGARTVAAAVLYSGGLLPPFVEYRRPEWPLPVVALHGGDGDRYHKGPWDVRFQPGSEALAAALVRDGSAVRICDHGFGHRLPPAWAGVLHAVVLQARGGSPIDLGPPPSACRDLVPDGTGAPEGP
jgi:poly(3-hydroxybutyrate) depolymerase